MRRTIAFLGAAAASCVPGVAAWAIAGDPSCDRLEAPSGPVFYDPFVIFFDSGSAAITPSAARILDNAAATYRSLPHCRLDVDAHADRAGPAAYTLALSRRRAKAIVAYLRRRGVRAEARIQYFGEGRPLVETKDGVSEPQNRYATILIGSRDSP